MGANVAIAQALGKKDEEACKKTVHTAILTALWGGIITAIIGELSASWLLTILNVPSDVFPYAILYLRIYFLGLPVILLYNFEAAIFRSIGETKVPFIAFATSGILNVILNLIFVIVFHMTVNGVAIATVIANAVSSILLFIKLLKSPLSIRVEVRRLSIDKESFKKSSLSVFRPVFKVRCSLLPISLFNQPSIL